MLDLKVIVFFPIFSKIIGTFQVITKITLPKINHVFIISWDNSQYFSTLVPLAYTSAIID